MKLPFEKAYCLHLAEANERYESSKSEFKKVGILDQVDYWWTVKRPFISKCADKFPELKDKYYDQYLEINPNVYNGVFNCAYEHYNIIKQAYIRGIESIIIFEDDVYFYVDENKFESIMNNIPNDFDIIQFHDSKRWYNDQYDQVQYNIKNNDITQFIKTNNDYYKLSTLCYALSRKGMKEVIDIHDKLGLTIADRVFNLIDIAKFNYYVPEYIVISPINMYDSASYILN